MMILGCPSVGLMAYRRKQNGSALLNRLIDPPAQAAFLLEGTRRPAQLDASMSDKEPLEREGMNPRL